MGINHGPKRQLELKLNGKLVHYLAPVTAAFDKYCIDSVADIAHNFSLQQKTLLKLMKVRPHFAFNLSLLQKPKQLSISLKFQQLRMYTGWILRCSNL